MNRLFKISIKSILFCINNGSSPPAIFDPPQLSQPPQLYSKFFNPPNFAKYWKVPYPPAKAGGVETMLLEHTLTDADTTDAEIH